MRITQYSIFLIILVSMLLGCSATSKPIRDQAADLKSFSDKLYLLEFDRNGKLANPLEVSRAAYSLKNSKSPIKKIIIMSYGWNGERSDALADYTKYIKNYLKSNGKLPSDPNDDILKDVAIFCISWDSKSKGINRLFNDFIAAPLLADNLSFIPDYLLFPISYWSKAGLADRIGSNDLRDTMEFIIEEVYGTLDLNSKTPIPGLYLIGHSFGARILSSLAQTRLGGVDDPNPFKYHEYIKGAVFILPAMIHLNIPANSEILESSESLYKRTQSKQPYPIVIAQSQHDHGNGFLYPLANIPLNSYTATGIENSLKIIHQGKRRSSQNKLAQLGADIVNIPASIAWSGISWPFNYLWTQSYELYNRHINYIPDTLAQLPLVEVSVDAVDEIFFNGKQEWGRRYKGLFNLGAINASAATTTAPILINFSTPRIYSEAEFLNHTQEFPNSVIYVDYSDTLKHGSYGRIDLKNKWWNFTIGWLDPIGSHINFEEEEIHKLIARILNDEIKINQTYPIAVSKDSSQ